MLLQLHDVQIGSAARQMQHISLVKVLITDNQVHFGHGGGIAVVLSRSGGILTLQRDTTAALVHAQGSKIALNTASQTFGRGSNVYLSPGVSLSDGMASGLDDTNTTRSPCAAGLSRLQQVLQEFVDPIRRLSTCAQDCTAAYVPGTKGVFTIGRDCPFGWQLIRAAVLGTSSTIRSSNADVLALNASIGRAVCVPCPTGTLSLTIAASGAPMCWPCPSTLTCLGMGIPCRDLDSGRPAGLAWCLAQLNLQISLFGRSARRSKRLSVLAEMWMMDVLMPMTYLGFQRWLEHPRF